MHGCQRAAPARKLPSGASGSRNPRDDVQPGAAALLGVELRRVGLAPLHAGDEVAAVVDVVDRTQSAFAAVGVARYECTKYTRRSPTRLSSRPGRLRSMQENSADNTFSPL